MKVKSWKLISLSNSDQQSGLTVTELWESLREDTFMKWALFHESIPIRFFSLILFFCVQGVIRFASASLTAIDCNSEAVTSCVKKLEGLVSEQEFPQDDTLCEYVHPLWFILVELESTYVYQSLRQKKMFHWWPFEVNNDSHKSGIIKKSYHF